MLVNSLMFIARRFCWSLILVAAFTLSLGSGSHATEPEIPANVAQMFRQMAMQRFETRLEHMRLSMQIDTGQAQMLREAGEAALTDWIGQQDPKTLFESNVFPEAVLAAVLKKSDRILGIGVTNRYRRDVELDAKLGRAVGASGFAVVLDQTVSLTADQFSQVRSLAATHWQPQWLNRVLTSGQERINILRPALTGFSLELKEILSPLQYRTLRVKHPSSARALMANMEPAEIPAAAQAFRKKRFQELQGVVAVRIEEIVATCQLDDQQSSKLGAAGEQLAIHIADKLQAAFVELKEKGPAQANQSAWAAISSNLFVLLQEDSDWRSQLNVTLTPNQLQLWSERQQLRQKRWSESAVGGIVALLRQHHRFTAQQAVDLIAVVAGEIVSQKAWSVNDHYRHIKRIPAAKVRDIFTTEQWADLSNLFAD